MIRIKKGAEPAELSEWKKTNAEVPQLLNYVSLHGYVKRAIRSQMLNEQRFLCAYTMLRIETIDDCHTEHVEPQSQSITEEQSRARTIDYQNMLACFPGRIPPPAWNRPYPYGALCKGGLSISADTFVSPLSPGVEDRFDYRTSGKVEFRDGDKAAESTIKMLGLNQKQLIELRRAAIEEQVLDAELSVAEAEVLRHQILVPDHQGRLPEFCLAIAQAAQWYVDMSSEVLDDGGTLDES